MDDVFCSYLVAVLEEAAGSLVELRLPGSSLSTSCIASLAAVISVGMPALKTVDLADNALVDDDIPSLWSAMSATGSLPSLDSLVLSNNQLTDTSMLRAIEVYDRLTHGALEIGFEQNCVGYDSNALGDSAACVDNEGSQVCYEGTQENYVCCQDSREEEACADGDICTMSVFVQTETDQSEDTRRCFQMQIIWSPPSIVLTFVCLTLSFTKGSCSV